MNKIEFLTALSEKLNGFPEDTKKKTLDYYSELIDDAVEDGKSESEAVEGFGPIDQIAASVLAETPLPKLVKEKVRPKHALSAVATVLIILGSVVWVPLLLAVIVVAFSAFAALLAIIGTAWTVLIVICIGGLMAIVYGFIQVFTISPLSGIFFVGCGFVAIGLGILLVWCVKEITKFIIHLIRKLFLWIKSLFVKKEAPYEK